MAAPPPAAPAAIDQRSYLPLTAALSADVHAESTALVAQLLPLDSGDAAAPADSGVTLASYDDTAASYAGAAWQPAPVLAPEGPWRLGEVGADSTPLSLRPSRADEGWSAVWNDVLDDHRNYYSLRNLGWLAGGAGVAGVLANTQADQWLNDDFYQESIRNARTDDYFETIHSMKMFGEGKYALPLYAAAVTSGWLADGEGALGAGGEWGARSLRTILVGAPPMLAMQRVLGASRPDENHSRSHWEPFVDDNGVSGHAFMGAVPFVVAAQMTENPWLRGGFYAGSTLAGLSRINDGHHYASQVAMGWWMAYLAASSVNRTETDLLVQPVVQTTPEGFSGVVLEKQW